MCSINRRDTVLAISIGLAMFATRIAASTSDENPATVLVSATKASQDAKASLSRQFKLDENLPADQRTTQRYIACVADSLDRYAARLAEIAPSLPPHVQSLPGIVAQTARSVRQSTTTAQVSETLRSAIVEVRKTLELVKADDGSG